MPRWQNSFASAGLLISNVTSEAAVVALHVALAGLNVTRAIQPANGVATGAGLAFFRRGGVCFRGGKALDEP